MPSYLSIAAAIGYLASVLMLSRRLRAPDAVPRSLPLGLAALAVALHFALHAAVYAKGGADLHFVPSLSLVALAIAGLATAIALWRPIEAIGVVAYPIAAVAALAYGAHAHETSPVAPEWQIALHVVLALAAFSVLSIAGLVAIMLEVQERALRERRVAGVMRAFPPLALVEGLHLHLIAGGFVLLTATVLTGVLFIHDWFAQHLVHKTVLTFAAWAVFGLLLFGHWRWGWRGIRAARFTLAGLVLLLLAFLGSKFVLEVLLGRTT